MSYEDVTKTQHSSVNTFLTPNIDSKLNLIIDMLSKKDCKFDKESLIKIYYEIQDIKKLLNQVSQTHPNLELDQIRLSLNAISDRLQGIVLELQNQQKKIDLLEQKYQEIEKNIQTSLAKFESKLDTLPKHLQFHLPESIKSVLQDVDLSLIKLKETVTENNSRVKELILTLENYKQLLEKVSKELYNRLMTLEKCIQEFKTYLNMQLKTIDKAIENAINDFKLQVSTFTKTIKYYIEKAPKGLLDRLKSLFKG